MSSQQQQSPQPKPEPKSEPKPQPKSERILDVKMVEDAKMEEFPLPSMDMFIEEQLKEEDTAFEQAIDELIEEERFEEEFQLVCRSFWQAFIKSTAFFPHLHRLGASPLAFTLSQKIIVSHHRSQDDSNRARRIADNPDLWTPAYIRSKQLNSFSRLDLLILDPGYPIGKIGAIQRVRIGREDFARGLANFFNSLDPPLPSATRDRIDSDFVMRVLKYIQNIPFGMVIISHPKVAYLRSQSAQASTHGEEQISQAPPPRPAWKFDVPDPILEVSNSHYGEPVATVGLVASSTDNRQGIVTSLHATNGINSTVFVNNFLGLITYVDPVHDTCFAEMTEQLPHGSKSSHGPLSGLAPALGEKAIFEGLTSGKTETTVIGIDWELPFAVHPLSQLKVYTKPDSLQGDSGSALLNANQQVIGFASYRSVTSTPYAAWIWAESVYRSMEEGLS